MKDYPIPAANPSSIPNPVYVKLLLDSLKYLYKSEKDRKNSKVRLTPSICRAIAEAAYLASVQGANYLWQSRELQAELERRLGVSSYGIWLMNQGVRTGWELDFVKMQRGRYYWALQLIKEFGG